MMLPRLTLVLGGANSGKSVLAEGLVKATARPRVYVATAQAFDPEMATKIAAHRAARDGGWRTVEAPLDIAAALAASRAADVVLLDCATLWLSNRMLADVPGDAGQAMLAALAGCAAPVVVVSNEVGQGIVPDTPLGRAFRGEQGRLNQRLAAEAGLVVLSVAGLPLVLKGTLPEALA